jgi:hypothetical protein
MYYLWIFVALLVNRMRFDVSIVILYLKKYCKEMQSLMKMRWHMAMRWREMKGKQNGAGIRCHLTMEHSLFSIVQTLAADAHTLAAIS